MGELLSQAEIDALLKGTSFGEEESSQSGVEELTAQEIDAIGEIGNISMGTASTTLFTLLSQKVLITTPNVRILTWGDLKNECKESFVAIRAEFTDGLKGINLLLLKEKDVKIITDLMMGGDGLNTDGEITDLHLSAISEAMNQMIGSSATSLASILNRRIDISPPKAFKTNLDENDFSEFDSNEKIVKVSFRMEIGELVDSEIMQLLPIDFAKEMVTGLIGQAVEQDLEANNEPEQRPVDSTFYTESSNQAAASQQAAMPNYSQPSQGYSQPAASPFDQNVNQVQYQAQPYSQEPVQNQIHTNMGGPQRPVNIQPIQFQSFEEGRTPTQKENINLLMDVPLQVTVELGRTHKLIKDILEFAPGSIIELDKLAGELVDILVNGKVIAKGEVVIIDESFGVRVSEIVQPSKRL
ncbi:MAG: flagellar motor switch phosphatase FliY [Ignavibacteriales bacterium]